MYKICKKRYRHPKLTSNGNGGKKMENELIRLQQSCMPNVCNVLREKNKI